MTTTRLKPPPPPAPEPKSPVISRERAVDGINLIFEELVQVQREPVISVLRLAQIRAKNFLEKL